MGKGTNVKSEVDYWVSTNENLIHFFEQKEISGILTLAEALLVNHPQRDILIPDFIAGFVLLPISLKTNKHWEEFERLTNPVFNLISERVKSNDFKEQLIQREISGKGTLVVAENTIFPIVSDELLLHAKRRNSIILTRKDVIDLFRDWKKYMKENYGEIGSFKQEGLKCLPHYTLDKLKVIFHKLMDVGMLLDKSVTETNFIATFQTGDLPDDWKRIRWIGTNPKLATLVLLLTGEDPTESIVNRYFDPQNGKYKSNSHRRRSNDLQIKRIVHSVD